MAKKENKNDDINTQKETEIRTATRTNLFQRLAARFGFTAINNSTKEKSPKKLSSNFKIINKPTDKQLLGKNPKEEIDFISSLMSKSQLSSTVQDLFDEWMSDTQNTYANIQEREERLNALTYMCDNEGIVKSAVTLVASEVASLSEPNAFTVISEDKEWQDQKNYLLKNVWKYDQPTIYSIAWYMFLHGEAFQGREVSSAGIIGINNLRPNEIAERLEFKPSRVADFKMQMSAGHSGTSTGFTANLTMPTNGSFGSSNLNFNFGNRQVTYKSTDNLLKDYIENIADTSSTEYFTSHLLGYRIYGDQLIAPWQISHFRFNSDVSEFWPYGQPPLLACLTAYKQLQRVMGLDDLEKLLSMPIHMYKVKTNGATTGRAFDIVSQVKERFENVGLVSSAAGLEGPSLCTNIWTSDDLVSIETVEGKNPSENSDKMQFFNSRLATATGIPMSYIDPSAEGFQMSGVALSTLFKPFRTLVENIRGVIIKEVEDTIRLHDSIVGIETPDFVLSMNVVNPVATDDTSGKLQLVDSIMDCVGNLLGVEKEALPQNVKKDIIIKYAGLSSTELEDYINTFKEEGAAKTEVSEEEMDASFGDSLGGDESEDTSSDDMEESLIKNKKKKLLQERYRLADSTNVLKYHLTEQLGTLVMKNSTNNFCEKYNDRLNEEEGNFLRCRFTKKRGKKRLDH